MDTTSREAAYVVINSVEVQCDCLIRWKKWSYLCLNQRSQCRDLVYDKCITMVYIVGEVIKVLRLIDRFDLSCYFILETPYIFLNLASQLALIFLQVQQVSGALCLRLLRQRRI